VPENGDYETVAGFVISRLGHLPAVGDEVEIDEGTLIVRRLDGRRIDRLRFVPKPPPEPEGLDEREEER
jgi:CBS domain containing-hemolysin-like protein